MTHRLSIRVFRFRQQLALRLDIGDEAAPASALGRAGWKRHHQQPNIARAPDGVAMLDALREIDKAPCADIERIIAAAKRQLTVEDIEDLVFGRVGVLRRLLALP